MSPLYDLYICVDDPEYLPSKGKLRDVVALFEKQGIINKQEYERLDLTISQFYPDEPSDGEPDNPVPVAIQDTGLNNYPFMYDRFEYVPNGPCAFPGFKIVDSHRTPWTLQFELHKSEILMDPEADGFPTRFVIAKVDLNYAMVPEFGELEGPVPQFDKYENISNREIKELNQET